MNLEALAQRLAWAEWRLQWAEWRIFQLEQGKGERAGAAKHPYRETVGFPAPRSAEERAAEDAVSPPAVVPADEGAPVDASASAPAPASASAAPASAFAPAPAPAPAPARGSGPARPPTPPAQPFDWESLIGVRLFAWLGGAALFVGVALFLNYSIQQNLIAPPLRVALGLLAGAGALFGGDVLRAKADRAGQAISGAGVAILYASLFAARSLYQLLPAPATFAGMVLVTAVAGVMAAKRDAFMLAVLGLIGGFLTPYLVSTGEDKPLALFGYVALLDAGVVIVAAKKKWPTVALLGLAGTSFLYLGWSYKFLDPEKLPYALFAAGALAGVFALTTPDAQRDGAKPGAVARATAGIASLLPLVLALIVSGTNALPVSPAVLVPYLVILSAGAWFAGRRIEVDALAPMAAFFSALTLALRADSTLFPSARVSTLALFAIVPAAFFVLWLVRRKAPEALSLRIATSVALAATSLFVVARVMFAEEGEAPLPLAMYAGVHVAMLTAMAAIEASSAFCLAAQGLSVLLLFLISLECTQARMPMYLPLVITPMIAFWALPFTSTRFRVDRASWLSSALSLLLHFPFLYLMARDSWGNGALGAVAVTCGVLEIAMLRFARAEAAAATHDALTALFGGVALLFLTSAFPILLHDEWLTVAWALEAAALGWLRSRVKHRGLLIAMVILIGATLVRLVINPAVFEYHPRSGTPILNWWLYSYGVSALAILGAWRLTKDDEGALKMLVPQLAAFAGSLLLFVLMNIEIADFYSTGTAVTFHFSSGGLAQDMTYTLAWGVFALALFGVGMIGKNKVTRIWALVLLCITVGKASLHDLWALGSLYRVGAIVGLAFALLAVSFLTQRFVLRKEEA